MSFDILRTNNEFVRRFIYPTGSNKSRFWCPQRTTLEQIVNYLYDPTGLMSTTPPANFWKNIGSVFFGADPQNAILSLRLYPCNFPYVNTTTFSILGQYIVDGQGHQITCEEITNERLAWVYDLGHYDIPYYENEDSFLSYDPYTKLFLYLPFASLLELDTKRYVGKTLQVNGIIDFYNGDLYYLISTTEDGTNYTLVEQVKTHIAVDVPLYKGFMFDLARNTMHSALKMPLELANEKMPSAVNDILKTNFVKNQMMYGNLDGVGSFVSPLKCNVIMYRPKIKYHLNDTSYNHLYGVPCKQIKLLSAVSGFTKVDGVHIKEITGATDEELREIEKILFNGFINNAGTTTLPISYYGSHLTWSNTSTTIAYGQSYTTTAIADTDYQVDSIQVIMGGVDISSTAVSGRVVSIPAVTGRLSITANVSKIPQTFTITYTNLVGGIMSNLQTTILEGSSYTCTFTPNYALGYYDIDYQPLVQMGEAFISYGGNTITISNVQDDITIIGEYPQLTTMNVGYWIPKTAYLFLPDDVIMNFGGLTLYQGTTQAELLTGATIDSGGDPMFNNSFIYGTGNIVGGATNVAIGVNANKTITYDDSNPTELGQLTKIFFTSSANWTTQPELLEWVDTNFTKET